MKTMVLISSVFSAVGAAVLGGALFAYTQSAAFVARSQHARGEVVRLVASRSGSKQNDSPVYRPVFRFTPEWASEPVEVTSSMGTNPPAYQVGETIEVLYDPASPQDASPADFVSLWGLSTLLTFLGSVFAAIGLGMFSAMLIKRRRIAYLLQHGTPVQTQLRSVELNRNLSVNGQHPYRVCSQWQDPATSQMHVFFSENVWYDPRAHVTGHSVRVFIDAANPRRYHMDLSFLPPLAQ